MKLPSEKRLVLRGLTLYQPWAWAVAHNKKTIENRTWAPWAWLLSEEVSTWIVIHAGNKYDPQGETFLKDRGVQLPRESFTQKGLMLGVGRLTGYVTASKDPMYMPGQKGWTFQDLRPFREPIAIGGQMGLWEIPKAFESAILAVINYDPRQPDLFGGGR